MNEFYRFSESPIWSIQKEYYKQLGVETWGKSMVPFFATSNSFVANGYAQTISAFITDCMLNDSKNLPVNIVELGAGHGKFSFMLLKALDEIYKGSSGSLPYKYIMTDIADVSIDVWRSHEKLKPYIEKGVLDFANFDVVTQKNTRMVVSGESFVKSIENKPTVIVANFLFDVLPYDLFRIKNKRIEECLVSVELTKGVTMEDSPADVIKNTHLKQKYISFEGKYDNENSYGNLLNYYQHNIKESIFQIPIHTLKTFDYFHKLSDKNLWLIGEEASIKLEQLDGINNTGIKEEGSFTSRVNLHALINYIEDKNTLFLSSDFPDARYDCYAILTGNNQFNYRLTKNSFQQSQVLFGPRSFFRLYKSLRRTNAELTDDGVLSLLELSKYDPTIVRRFRDIILAVCSTTKGFKRLALVKALLKTWDNYYDIGEKNRVAYYLARMFTRLGAVDEAIELFNKALAENNGDQHKIYYYLGELSLKQYNKNEAIVLFETALSYDSTYQVAKGKLRSLGVS